MPWTGAIFLGNLKAGESQARRLLAVTVILSTRSVHLILYTIELTFIWEESPAFDPLERNTRDGAEQLAERHDSK
jgi:hypothetical protein